MTCPYRRRNCHVVADDIWTTDDAWLHRHDHRRCWASGVQAWHPDDPPTDLHPEPDLYVYARRPLQLRWSQPWQVVASSLLLVRTTRYKAEAAAETIFGLFEVPAEMAAEGAWEVLMSVCHPLGLAARRADYLRALGALWPTTHTPGPAFVADLPGCGRYVLDAYRIFALHDDLDPADVEDRVLRLHLELRQIVWSEAIGDQIGDRPPT